MDGKKKSAGENKGAFNEYSTLHNGKTLGNSLATDYSVTDEKGLKETGIQSAQEVACVKAAPFPTSLVVFFSFREGVYDRLHGKL